MARKSIEKNNKREEALINPETKEKPKRSVGAIVLNIILIIILINLLIFAGYIAYINYPRAAEPFGISDNETSEKEILNLSSNANQFYPNMRFNHNNISYFLLDCSEEKILRLENAFNIIKESTGVITFYRIEDKENADIRVACTEGEYETEKNVFVAGEGGPTEFINLSLYPVILKGKILLYKESSCDYPVTELHELIHVFGFNHVKDKETIMYPYLDCKQRISNETIEILKGLYSVEPKAELYFENISAVKTGIYLNFSLKINNEGLKNAENVRLWVYSESLNEIIDSFDLKTIALGSGKTFYVNNLKLSSLNTKKILFEIKTTSKEFDSKNNVLELEVVS